ncbi:MAG: ROK family protein [Bacteroidota bacterium]
MGQTAQMSPGVQTVVIGLDVGGTSVKGGLVDRQGHLVGDPVTFDPHSHEDAESILAAFAGGVGWLLQQAGERPVAGIGVGMPGPFDYERGVSLIKNLGKYDALYGLNLADSLRAELALAANFPVRFLNDAVAFALGEVYFGAGRGFERVMAITLGTGCGSAFIVGGRSVKEGDGIPADGYVYNLPFRGGIVDDWLSRRGILRLWQSMQPGAQPGHGQQRSDATADLDVVDLARLAMDGDTAARQLFDAFGELIAGALAPTVAAFCPDCLVIGGQIARSFALFGPRLKECLLENGFGTNETCTKASATQAGGMVIVPAADIDAAAVKGAASYIWWKEMGM